MPAMPTLHVISITMLFLAHSLLWIAIPIIGFGLSIIRAPGFVLSAFAFSLLGY